MMEVKHRRRRQTLFWLVDHVIYARFPTFLPTFFQPHSSLLSPILGPCQATAPMKSILRQTPSGSMFICECLAKDCCLLSPIRGSGQLSPSCPGAMPTCQGSSFCPFSAFRSAVQPQQALIDRFGLIAPCDRAGQCQRRAWRVLA
jgi:hypothetical protein